MMARSSGLGVLMMSVKNNKKAWLSMSARDRLNWDLKYLLHPAFWECPGVFLLCQKPGLGCPEDHPI